MGMSSMMMALMVAGIVALLAGLLAILLGIPVKEFSFGNTLILAGSMGACTGLILLGLSAVVAELKLIARRLAADARTAAADARVRAALPQATSTGPAPPVPAGEGGFLFSRDQTAAEQAGHVAPAVAPVSPPPWQEETPSRVRQDVPIEPQPAEAASAAVAKPKRNLMFSSSMRRERARAADAAAAPEGRSPPPVPEAGEVPPASFDDAWPKTERARASEVPPQRRAGRPAPSEPAPSPVERPPPPPRAEDQPAVTVLKSGVVDGMAYSLYSDGSIEAQMPEGLMRFASLDELTAHIERRA
jgi:hypothetical protein